MKLIFGLTLMLIGVVASKKKDLENKIFRGYEKSQRPVLNDGDVIYVDVSLEIKNILEFEIAKGLMTSNLILGLSWHDANINWEEEKENVSYIKTQLEKVWYPNVQICNSATGKFTFDGDTGVTLTSNGSTSLYIDRIFNTYCKVNVNKYPFDEHECDISVCFEHQMNTEIMLDYFLYEVTYKPISNQWDYRYEYSEVEKQEIITAGVIVYCKRKYSSATVTKIIPPIMLTLLILSVYVLPASSGEKVSVAITVFLANIVYLSETEKKLGNNSREPSIYLIYLLNLTLVSGFSSISSVIVCKLFAHESGAITISEKDQETNGSKNKIGIIGNADEPIIKTKSKRRIKKCRIKHQMLDKSILSASVLFLLLYIIIVSSDSI
ncbi:acetylcholine receptor subunit delta-like [Octopus sinensis]|uniref:Acetylcholine receptor subunit delta-like n=1 Tax=Octopus sinensis TaxID=2607531 RepID=A0A7E6FGT5_9MOLL|nr:acetylcholine receptor subunit delta-like [Octopus sinensis]